MSEFRRTQRARQDYVSEPPSRRHFDEPVKRKHRPTSTWVVLVFIGALATVGGIFNTAVADGSPLLLAMGLSLMSLGALIRPVDKILAVLIDINEKLGD